MKTIQTRGLFILLLAVILIISACASEKEFYVEDTESFEFQESSAHLKDFSAKKIVGRPVFFGEVKTAEQAASFAEQIWVEVYGKDQILQQRPYIVRYDKEQGVWLVNGDSGYLNGGVGGVAYAYIASDDGELLAIVHDE